MIELIASDKTTRRSFESITSIPRMGTIIAAAVMVEMPELGTLEVKQVASLAGLAP